MPLLRCSLVNNPWTTRYSARAYYLLHDGRRYDSKAIMGAARGYAVPTQGIAQPTVVDTCSYVVFETEHGIAHEQSTIIIARKPMV
jgi:hypothetical protein